MTGACWRWETNPTQTPVTPNGGEAPDPGHCITPRRRTRQLRPLLLDQEVTEPDLEPMAAEECQKVLELIQIDPPRRPAHHTAERVLADLCLFRDDTERDPVALLGLQTNP